MLGIRIIKSIRILCIRIIRSIRTSEATEFRIVSSRNLNMEYFFTLHRESFL